MGEKNKNKQEKCILYSVVHWFAVLLLIAFLMILIDHYTNTYFSDYKSQILFLSGWYGLMIYEGLFLKYRK